MERILNLQTLQMDSSDQLQSTSSCSFVACRFCSSTSDSGCNGSEDEINAI
ncbi:class III lanthipeptide [Idiomarina abyssalis]|uniref:class III lanthipeptide n=1 Tax=Idiomarina abyssalis TaxID=86102 RepID=UPI003A934330